MPTWLTYILYAAALISAAGVIWKKLLEPTLKFYGTAAEMVPLLKDLTDVFADNPDALKVLYEMAGQFKSDSGSTLKDQINRLEAAAVKQEIAAKLAQDNADHLKIGVETQKQLAEDDRRKLGELMVQLRMNAEHMSALAGNVASIQKDARGVAEDLSAAHKRADELQSGEAGAAADAAAQQTVKEKLQDLSK